MSIPRVMVALFVGAIVAVIVGLACQIGLSALFAPPESVDASTPAGAAAVMAAMPLAARVAVVAGWLVTDTAAALVVMLLAGRRPWLAWAGVAFPLLATIANYGMLPYPVWMMVAGVAMAPLAALTVASLFRPR